jgi:hypothetical protein
MDDDDASALAALLLLASYLTLGCSIYNVNRANGRARLFIPANDNRRSNRK